MNRHQVLTGAANSLDHSVSIGSVENNHFTAYGSGFNLVILSSNFDRVQVISGRNFSDSVLRCIECTLDTGKIAAGFGNRVIIFEPTPSIKKASHNIQYKWVEIGSIELNSNAVCVSWNNESNRLLVGCESGIIQMWTYNPNSLANEFEDGFGDTTKSQKADTSNLEGVKFSINEDLEYNMNNISTSTNENSSHFKEADESLGKQSFPILKKIWETKLANCVKYLKFSPDGSLFASFGENDRLVKVWHEVRPLLQLLNISEWQEKESKHEYDFVYLAHPRAVTGISWRQISKFMPRGMISNALITSCKDNICRIWLETIIPDDGLLHSNEDESTYDTIAKSTRHKRKLLNKLHKMRFHSHFPHLPHINIRTPFNHKEYNLNSRESLNNPALNNSSYTLHNLHSSSNVNETLPMNQEHKSLHNSFSCHELNVKQNYQNGFVAGSVQTGFHFHLAGFIDPEAGIPLHLLSNVKSTEANFNVHWINNKDFNFTYAAELFSRDIYEKIRKLKLERLSKKSASENGSNEENLSDILNNTKKKSSLKSNSTENMDSRVFLASNMNSKTENSNESNIDFLTFLNIDEETKNLLFGQSIDHKLDTIVKEWFTSHDVLFSIHPTDGSILIWLVDWLDEYLPGSYRQAQVSFHAKLPNSIPVGDALSLTNSVFLYTEPIKLESGDSDESTDQNDDEVDSLDKKMSMNNNYLFLPGVVQMVSKHSNGTLNLWRLQFQDNSKYQSLVNVSHVSRTCGHRFRVSDITSHPILPFLLTNSINDLYVNDFESSAVNETNPTSKANSNISIETIKLEGVGNELLDTFQKGLIIWGVEPVGPLSKSGGIYELARIDSSKENAYENIAWFPCFLPSSTLGNSSSSPSTLFASTDSTCITVYQAVFDARTLLHDLQNQDSSGSKTAHGEIFKLASHGSTYSNTTDIPFNSFNVVSIQSTARPGCIIELEKLADSNGGWSKADLFHVYQEGLVHQFPTKDKKQNQSKISQFKETYYLVLLEKRKKNNKLVETIHMWRITIISIPSYFVEEKQYADPNLNRLNSDLSQANEFKVGSFCSTGSSFNLNFLSNRINNADGSNLNEMQKNRLTITSTRVCQQDLELPEGVHVVCADTAAADLSSSSMFTLNKVPYLFSTACSDGQIRFWSCKNKKEEELNDEASEQNQNEFMNEKFEFFEWEFTSTLSSFDLDLKSNEKDVLKESSSSRIKINSYPLAISCSYNSRFAVAFQKDSKNDDSTKNKLTDREITFVNFCVHIYECESTGGSEWKLEDCIHLDDVVLPKIDSGINFDYIFGNQQPIRPAMSCHSFKNIVFNTNVTSNTAGNNSVTANGALTSNQSFGSFVSATSGLTSDIPPKLPEIPSNAAKISIKRQYSINNQSKTIPNKQLTEPSDYKMTKKLIKLDWASTENGSHILTIGLGNQIFVYSCVTKEIAYEINKSIAETNKLMKSERKNSIISLLPNAMSNVPKSSSINNGLISKAQTNIDTFSDSLVKWIQFRSFELDSADDMQALPTQIKWVRDGLLVVGLNTEMQVYSQWSSLTSNKQHDHQQQRFSSSKSKLNTENLIKKAPQSLLVPKNHSVLDLNKLNKLTSTKNMQSSGKKDYVTSSISEEQDANEESLLNKKSTSMAVFDDNQILELIQDSGIFMQANHAWPVLPQYHPKQLFELMNSGKINRVKAILMHLTRCIIDCEMNHKNRVNPQKKLNRKMSITCETEIPEEKTMNYLEIEVIPPLPLFALFAADNDSDEITTDNFKNSNQKSALDTLDDGLNARKNSFDELSEFKVSLNDDTFDDENYQANFLGAFIEKKLQNEKNELKKAMLNNSSNNIIFFNSKVCQLLNEYLTEVQLNGLTSIDQMYLVALADTVANVKCDAFFSKDEDIFSRKKIMNSNSDGLSSDNISQTVDNSGLKFLLALRSYNYLLRTLPTANRDKLKEIGLGTANFAWAFHSECEQELINAITSFSSTDEASTTNVFGSQGSNTEVTWSDLRQFGVGWWLKNMTLLRKIIEKLAKCLFQQNSNPLDAALFYLAMKKKGVLLGLFKTVKDVKMTEFFKNDFNEQKWQTSALKNAFVLLGKQRFEHAAAFFLLAGRLKDAIEVCIRNLNDLQLALVLVRLYETDLEKVNSYIKTILCVEVLGYKLMEQTNQSTNELGTLSQTSNKNNVTKDPFLRSMAYWLLKDYKQSLQTLFEIDIGANESKETPMNRSLHFSSLEGNNREAIIPHVFNFYTFLKNHPLVLRSNMVTEKQSDNYENKFNPTSTNTKLSTVEAIKSNTITPIERRLHFIAAYYHLINGCPLLALDVLSKLPKYIYNANEIKNEAVSIQNNTSESQFDFTDNFKSQPKIVPQKVEKAADFDWSAPVKRFDDEELELKFSDSEEEKLSDDDEKEKKSVDDLKKNLDQNDFDDNDKLSTTLKASNEDPPKSVEDLRNKTVDTFAQQIKFISCLKILIGEMSTLATGFEVQGGQLRYYMYYWLERETQVLRELGDYKNEYEDKTDSSAAAWVNNSLTDDLDKSTNAQFGNQDESILMSNSEQISKTSLLHEQVLRDQKTFQAKINRLNKRKEWLRSNELLLRTFLSYCSLHSASGVGLSSVKMELVLLMQELVEDRSMKQLLLPVPVPTTIPLLSASIATSKNVVAGPIQMLKNFVNDILSSLSAIHTVPTIFDSSVLILTIKETSVSLSSCIYQCLCDSDAFTVSENQVNTGMQGFSRNILYKSSYLMSGMKKNSNDGTHKSDKSERVLSSPKNWPGVSGLTKLLEREQDIEAPKLKILLFESLVSVYVSLLANSFIFYDCSTLRRLLLNQWDEKMWNMLFGGGCQTEYRYKTQSSKVQIDDENAKQRMKINAKLGHRPSFAFTNGSNPQSKESFSRENLEEEKVYIREHFIPPEISMINYFLKKPYKDVNSTEGEVNDSDDELADSTKRDVLDDDPETIYGKRYLEHMNPKSYSWCLMRYAILKYTIFNIQSFLSIIGIELQELATLSPLVHQILKTIEHWQDLVLAQLNAFNGPPDDYIPGCNLNNSINLSGPKILKYQSMLDPANSPFVNEKFTQGPRRLWHFLVTKKCLHEVFIRYIFKKKAQKNVLATPLTTSSADFNTKRNDNMLNTNSYATQASLAGEFGADSNASNQYTSFCKIVHKDQEPIYNFCLNERDKNMLALCTSKEIIEMDIKNLLVKNAPIDDECEMDILALQNTKGNYEQDVYVIGNIPQNESASVYEGQQKATQPGSRSNSFSNVILKRSLKEVRRLASHPTLPYYLSGTNESVVKLWHWGSSDPLSSFKQSERSSSAKITKLSFNTHGNKFGVSDMDGYLHLYQLLGCSFKSYLTLRCHKIINDFLFIDSSSILLTIGTSNDSYVISIWDTLLPPHKSLIKSYKEIEVPSGTCAAYSPLNHFAYCGNRKGEVNIYDIRTHKKLQKFMAHESSVKTIALDQDEYYIATGSSEGNVKIWNLKTLEPISVFHNEHSKSSLIRNFNSGVNQLQFTSDNKLLSCGVDGTLVIRSI